MSKIKNPMEETEERKLSCLIYGQPGIGKTTLALSAPKPLLIDFDRGIHRVEKRYQSPYVSIEKYDDMREVLASTDEIKQFETIVVDGLGKLVDCLGDHLATKNPKLKSYDGTLTLQGWGVVKTSFNQFVRSIFKLNKHLIFIAHEREETIDRLVIKRPDVSGSPGKDLIKDIDLMGYMRIANKKRMISFSPDDAYYAKNSLDLEPIIEVPATDGGNDFFEKRILARLREKQEEETKLTREYEEFVSFRKEQIDHAKTVADLNAIYEAFKSASVEIFDSETAWKTRLNEQCKMLGANFDRTAGKFVQQISHLN